MSVWIFLTKICERAFWPTDICDVTMSRFILSAPWMFVQHFMAIRWKVVETFHSKGNQNQKNSRRIYRIGFILWEPSTSLQTSTSQSLNHFIRVSWVQLTVKTGIGTSRTTLRRTKLTCLDITASFSHLLLLLLSAITLALSSKSSKITRCLFVREIFIGNVGNVKYAKSSS